MQDAYSLFPITAIYRVVEVRNIVAERTTAMAKRNATIHAARSLLVNLVLRLRQVYLLVVANAFLGIPGLRHFPVVLHKSIYLSHVVISPCFLFDNYYRFLRHGFLCLSPGKNGLVVSWHNFDKSRRKIIPVVKQQPGRRTAGVFQMLRDECPDLFARSEERRVG